MMVSRRSCVAILLVVTKLTLFVSAQDCLLAAAGRSTPFRDDNASPSLPSGTHAIVTSYKFGCCGNITAWQTYVQPGGNKHQHAYNITFEVWRPSPSVQDNGCYIMVGANRFTSISLLRDGLVSETLKPSNILTVQPGDVVGYFTLSKLGKKDGIQLDNNQNIDSVWYHTSPNSELNIGAHNCPFPVGTETDGIMMSSTNAAPILSVSISSFSCPPTSTVLLSSSTLLPPSMIAATFTFPTQLSDTISQPPITSIPLPSGTLKPTVVSRVSTDMSQQSASPTSVVSSASPTSEMFQQSASSTSAMFLQSASSTSAMFLQSVSPTSDISQQSSPTSDISQQLASLTSYMYQQSASPTSEIFQQASPTSDLFQQMANSTPFVPPLENNDGLDGVVAAIVVVIMIVVCVLVVMVVVLLWKRKISQKNMKVEVDEKSLNLSFSNLNYNPSFLSSLRKHQNSKKQRSSAIKPPKKPPRPNMETTTFKSLKTEDNMNYMDPMVCHKTLAGSSPNYANVTLSPYQDECKVSAELTFSTDKDMSYHVVGPNVGGYVTDKKSNRPTPPPLHPPVSTKRSIGCEQFYHTLEEALDDPSVQYEDPTLLKFRQQDSAKQKGAFESTGYYVPTEEQRKAFGKIYENVSVGYDRLNFFVEDQIYWTPACTTSGLYGQLASKRYREIHRHQIRIMEQLGSGQFGEVCKAMWTVDGHTLELAVKTLKPGASEDDMVKFLQEAAIMGQFSHSNVIKMYGIVTLGTPVLICLEILANGDLRSYLQGLKLSGSKYSDFTEVQVMFLKFAKDIAAGMDYLSRKSFVHRDLAARNILLDKTLTCKVADFGMARDLMDGTYYKSSGGKIPVKWTAPEAVLYKKFSADSDVWSYGMVLFEIWSVAKKPFSTVSNNQVLRLIQTGYCQAPPPGCPRGVYELMVDCWNPDHTFRPSFKMICSCYLHQSSARILYWAPADETLSPTVGVCGSPLEGADKLYLDLQEKYMNSNLKAC